MGSAWWHLVEPPKTSDVGELALIHMGTGHGASHSPVQARKWPIEVPAAAPLPRFADIVSMDSDIESMELTLSAGRMSPATKRRLVAAIADARNRRWHLYDKYIYG